MLAGWKMLDTENNFFTTDLSEDEDLKPELLLESARLIQS